MDDAAVELLDVSKSLGGRRVVDGVSLRVARGEFFALLGPSGCGKTTTLRMIAGFEHPDTGRVLLGGRDVAGVPPYRRDCNLVFQSYALFPHLSVAGNVAFGLEVGGKRSASAVPRESVAPRVAEALAMVRLDGLGERMPHQLSGGQQQRVAVARALARRPAVLLLDEPLGALDLQLRKEMQLELKRLQRRLGTAFVHVTHDQEEAMALCDRIAVMDGGRVAQVGTPADLWERPATAFVARFLGDANLLAGTLRAAGGDGAIVDVAGGSLRAADAAGFVAGARVSVVLRPERIETAAVGASNAAAGDGLRGTVEETIFGGADVRLVVRLADGVTVSVRRAADAAPTLRAGDAVRLTAAPSSVRLVPAERST